MKLGHIGLPVADITKAKTFYDAVSQSIGLKLITAHEDFVGYGTNGSYEFYVNTNKSGISGLHVCFEVETRDHVDAFYKAGLDQGGKDNGTPGIRTNYSPTYYAAFIIDPDGNNIEAVCRK